MKKYTARATGKRRRRTIKSMVREKWDFYACVEGKLYHMDVRDIIYVEHNSRSVLIHTVQKVLRIPYMTLEQIHGLLGEDILLRCHRSFLVNSIYIESINRANNYMVLKNNMGKIAIGRKYKRDFLKEIHLQK